VSPYSLRITTYAGTYQVAPTMIHILWLFTPCIEDHNISFLQTKKTTISYAYNSTDIIATCFVMNMPTVAKSNTADKII
jgi:hypothetical protein